jgi:hypothetical protein
MARRWRSFDQETTDQEFLSIPLTDMIALFDAMRLYALEAPGGFVVKSYGKGLMMIKATNQTSGRCLFFTVSDTEGDQALTALLAYKKESDEVPARVLTTARQRMEKAN